MAKGISRKLDKVLKKVNKEIIANATGRGLYASALSGEGYAGGYKDAINDVINVLNGVQPKRRNYWD